MKRNHKYFMVAIGLSILILDSMTALEGARQGIELCLQTVIPSLFPFILLSTILVSMISGLRMKWSDRACKLLRLPEGSGALLLIGLLGGYPTGAIAVSHAYADGQISKKAAERMLPLCNQCGPAFLFGMMATSFGSMWFSWSFWAITIVSILLTAWILPTADDYLKPMRRCTALSSSQALQKTIHTMASICGWVTVFRIGIHILDRWILWYFPDTIQVLITGMLELSNGCMTSSQIHDLSQRYILCAAMLGSGGLCVTMQTCSILSPDLAIKPYLIGKGLQCVISMSIAWIVIGLYGGSHISAVMLPILILVSILLSGTIIRAKNSSFSRKIRV